MIQLVRARLGCEDGQALVEYTLIITLIGLVAIAGLTLVGDQLGPTFSEIADSLKL
jgi:Flp pilus assembly pilin Flp